MTRSLTLIGALLCLGLLGRLLSAGPTAGQPALLLVALAGLALELKAVPSPGFGFFTASPALSLALALSVGPPVAAFLATAWILVRTLARGGEGAWVRAAEAVADLLPILAALSLTPWAGAWIALAWLLLAGAVPPILAAGLDPEANRTWGLHRVSLGLPLTALAVLGVLGGTLNPWLVSGLAVVGLALQRALTPERQEDLEQRTVQAEYALEANRLQLIRRVDYTRKLEQLTRSLTRCQQPAEVFQVLSEMAQAACPQLQSTALFLAREEGLTPVMCSGPQRDRVASAALLKLSEPVVARAWSSGKVAHEAEASGEQRIFAGEASALGLFLEGEGVFYLGQAAPGGFTPEQLELLGMVAAHSSVALHSVRRHEQRQQALELHQAAHSHLQEVLARLTGVLDSVRTLTVTLEAPVLLAEIERACRQVLVHDLGLVYTPQGCQRAWGPPVTNPQAVQALAAAITANSRPLLLEDVEGTRFPSPHPGLRSWLGVPLLAESGCLAVLLVGSARFNRTDQDILFLLGYLAAAAWTNVETHRLLRESQAQVVQSSKMAAVGQLAAGVAHELNTPLAAIVIAIESALDALERRPERVRKRLETANNSAEHAQSVVSKLLFYCHQGGEIFQPVSLDTLVKDTLDLVGGQLERDGVRLVNQTQPVPQVWASPTELRQVVTNLLVNARDAVLSPGARGRGVSVRTALLAGRVVLDVEDEGPGIPPEVLSRIFEPFFTTKEVGSGTGLGLSVSQQIAGQHQGQLEAVSPPGRGACFRLSLPVWEG